MRAKLAFICILALLLTGCQANREPPEIQEATPSPSIFGDENTPVIEGDDADAADGVTQNPTPPQPVIRKVDFSAYFQDLNACAVFHTPANHAYDIYNTALADEMKSPCSTFKIVSSLLALENRVIVPDGSVRKWSGETFWNADWNKDIDFESAFKTSCVWYFRQVIDDLGKDTLQDGLDTLSYGNCDISDWEGRLNIDNQNPALTGFWIESSLKISPKQQTEVLARIFEQPSEFEEASLQALKDVMKVDQNICPSPIYGKTGSGKQDNQWADAWFVGLIEREAGNTYFAVYLGKSDREISSALAKEIALEISGDYYNN